MNVVFAGSGGGHFYPLIAIAEELSALLEEEKVANVRLFFVSDAPYDERMLFEHHITFQKLPTGKLRTYEHGNNFLDIFRTLGACVRALWILYRLYPDVVIGKGGYGSFPTLLAARILRIPVIIHESDSVPGRVNTWAGAFAQRVAVAYPEAAKYFPHEKVATTGNPIRHSLMLPYKEGAHQFFGTDPLIPTVLVLGGSQGSQKINDAVVRALPDVLSFCQIIHQVGEHNINEVRALSELTLEKFPALRSRYHPVPFLDDAALIRAAGITDLVVSRAGSTIFEISLWGLPAILIPLSIAHADHQRKNAFIYARAGAAEVIEEQNLSPHLLAARIKKLMDDKSLRDTMASAAKAFSKNDAAAKIARQVVEVLVAHKKLTPL